MEPYFAQKQRIAEWQQAGVAWVNDIRGGDPVILKNGGIRQRDRFVQPKTRSSLSA
jgi:hypothetical protein